MGQSQQDDPNMLIHEVHRLSLDNEVIHMPRAYSSNVLENEITGYVDSLSLKPDEWGVCPKLRYQKYNGQWWLETFAYVGSYRYGVEKMFLLESKLSSGKNVGFDLYTAFAQSVYVSAVVRVCSIRDLYFEPQVDLVFFENPFVHVQANIDFPV